MEGECYFCHGIVIAYEEGDILLARHGSHEVYMHEECARGHNVVEEANDAVEVVCPECGAVETR